MMRRYQPKELPPKPTWTCPRCGHVLGPVFVAMHDGIVCLLNSTTIVAQARSLAIKSGYTNGTKEKRRKPRGHFLSFGPDGSTRELSSVN